MPQPLNEENLNNITKKVYALYAKHGFDGISMDEVSSQTNISKATLYRYFTSKEDIVVSMVSLLTSHLDSLQFDSPGSIDDVLAGFQKLYIKSIIIAALTGSEFLTALEKKLPETYASYRTSLCSMQERSADFFKQLQRTGYCRDIPFSFVSKQFSNMIPAVINMDYLEKHHMSLPEALREYYRMFLTQILKENYLYIADRQETYNFVPGIAKMLQNDFFIDSIRR